MGSQRFWQDQVIESHLPSHLCNGFLMPFNDSVSETIKQFN